MLKLASASRYRAERQKIMEVAAKTYPRRRDIVATRRVGFREILARVRCETRLVRRRKIRHCSCARTL